MSIVIRASIYKGLACIDLIDDERNSEIQKMDWPDVYEFETKKYPAHYFSEDYFYVKPKKGQCLARLSMHIKKELWQRTHHTLKRK